MEATKLYIEKKLHRKLNVLVPKKEREMMAKVEEKDQTIAKLKEEVQTLTENLHNVESSLGYFHKRFEQHKGMLKFVKDNEEVLNTKLKNLEQENGSLLERIQKALEKESSEMDSVSTVLRGGRRVRSYKVEEASPEMNSVSTVLRGGRRVRSHKVEIPVVRYYRKKFAKNVR